MSRILTCILALILAACSEKPAESNSASVTDQINRIADEFVDGYFAQYPEEVYEIGYPNSPMDRFGDR